MAFRRRDPAFGAGLTKATGRNTMVLSWKRDWAASQTLGSARLDQLFDSIRRNSGNPNACSGLRLRELKPLSPPRVAGAIIACCAFECLSLLWTSHLCHAMRPRLHLSDSCSLRGEHRSEPWTELARLKPYGLVIKVLRQRTAVWRTSMQEASSALLRRALHLSMQFGAG